MVVLDGSVNGNKVLISKNNLVNYSIPGNCRTQEENGKLFGKEKSHQSLLRLYDFYHRLLDQPTTKCADCDQFIGNSNTSDSLAGSPAIEPNLIRPCDNAPRLSDSIALGSN